MAYLDLTPMAGGNPNPPERVLDGRSVPAVHPQQASVGFPSSRRCPRPCQVRLRGAAGVARAKRGDDGGTLSVEGRLLGTAFGTDRGGEAGREDQSRIRLARSAQCVAALPCAAPPSQQSLAAHRGSLRRDSSKSGARSKLGG